MAPLLLPCCPGLRGLLLLLLFCPPQAGAQSQEEAQPELSIETLVKPDSCSETSSWGDTLHIHYTGKLEDGRIIDSSLSRDPLVVELGKKQVIPGSPYYDNVRPLCYSDSDAVLLCFDISRPDTLDSVLKKWKTEVLDFCPSTRMLLIGCKSDLRTDLSTLMELSHQKMAPVSYEQGCAASKQLGAESYLESSAFTSEKSVHSIFRSTSTLCMNKAAATARKTPVRSLSKRILHLPSRSELISSTFKKEKTRSCCIM